MDKVVAALTAQQDELTALLVPLDDAGWQVPSRCPGWTVADVVLHLAQSDEMAVASVQGRFHQYVEVAAQGLGPVADVDEGVALLVAAERGLPDHEVLDRWQAGAIALRDELAGCDPAQRVDWVAGQMSARTLATTRLAETWIHAGDIALPLGHEVVADDRLWHIARLAWRTLPYAFARAGRPMSGPVAFDLEAPNGDSWSFASDEPPATTITGTALDLCTVAGQRGEAAGTTLSGDGPDAAGVLDLVRTFA